MNMNNNVNVTDVNEAIINVLTHFKKDCPKDFALVESMGYDVSKNGDHYVISNPSKSKSLQISGKEYDARLFRSVPRIRLGGYRDQYVSWAKRYKVNFVRFLETPANVDFYRLQNTWEKHASQKWRDIIYDFRWAKSTVSYAQEYVDDDKKAIERATKDLQRHIKNLVERQTDLDALRKKYGMKGAKA